MNVTMVASILAVTRTAVLCAPLESCVLGGVFMPVRAVRFTDEQGTTLATKNVYSSCDFFKVRWSDACRHTAKMIDFLRVVQRAVLNEKREAVGECARFARKVAIAISGASAIPNPASAQMGGEGRYGAFLDHITPKALDARCITGVEIGGTSFTRVIPALVMTRAKATRAFGANCAQAAINAAWVVIVVRHLNFLSGVTRPGVSASRPLSISPFYHLLNLDRMGVPG